MAEPRPGRIARTHDHLHRPKVVKRSRLSREEADEALAVLPDETVKRLLADPEKATAFFGELEAAHAAPRRAPLLDREALAVDRNERQLAGIDKREQEERVQQARAAHRAAVEEVEAFDAMRVRIRDDLRSAEAKKAAVVNTNKADNVKALFAGEPAPDNGPSRRKIERWTEKIAAAEAALDMAAPKRDALVAAERAAHVALCDEVNDLVAAGAQRDMQAVRKQLTALGPTLASLWAGDIIRERLLRTKWSFDHDRVRPMSGAIVVKTFLAGISERLRNGLPELEEAAIEAAAESLADKMEENQ